MTTIRLTMAQALLRFLDNQYISVDGQETKFVRGVMGIFGHGNVTGIGEALERSPGSLQFIQGKNEQGMAHAATAYAKQSGRRQIWACTSSIGPGALNMVTAAGTATVNRIPLLLLPGDNFACRQPDPVLQQLEVQSDYTVSAVDAFRPVSRYWDRIVRPEQLMTAALQAIRVLTDPAETGAVTLALPQDVQAEAYDYPEAFFAKRVHHIDRRPPSADAVSRAAKLIAGKRKPLIIAGGGVHYADAVESLHAFAKAFGIPVAETQAGKSVLPWNDELNMGGVGTTGTLAANRLAHEADVIIGVGTRYSDFTTASKWAFANPDVQFVNLNISPFDSVKLDGCGVIGDARVSLDVLREALSQLGYTSGYGAGELEELKSEWTREVDRLYALESDLGLTQTRALGVLNETLQPSDVIVCAAGSLPGDLHRVWRPSEPRTYHMEYGFSCMGYEVSGAFGAALAEPNRDVYAFVGDGSYLMLHSELVTSLQEGVKMTVILFDNNGYQCIHNLQRGHGSDGFGNEFRFRDRNTGQLSGSYMPIDFAAHARSLGVPACTVTTAEGLREALLEARKCSTSTLIEVKVLPGTNTDGYDSWWRVDVPEVSVSAKVNEAHAASVSNTAEAASRTYR
ncbi:3D-(3,5/4)-trihydroxycyclohexane-1,2-dione acylhydrolase (decyclizing) [Paenibacillus cellulosilyticus]|uniref:3D-(3,5/4)-trihydroxycyclohexane-1,2-dione acylhydrolase (Decyclizing) n=1 Tax=Paenibacillus cellulosilyticus TaxID=375489 RepID=A0A2V2YLS1_9BACL|nr:3D-(3,5/4)-trihydroxycyclohexane-1,2-dione acylhydrolase (decyclizing) [Paenibacillus cellulosilyticus]PWV94421.1 3D-(3,5/4)-trihydroxycyclohexane-1,2-dione acylhydrolase (decyclizing) [Paenibacillus cellulosilyticus]QKS43913.1 3D-(3,5/4)-trihydroxycyclohexane-1,2-dione acylhydrolase (decyclizing) [Paenibacillus cellulosilyticus]